MGFLDRIFSKKEEQKVKPEESVKKKKFTGVKGDKSHNPKFMGVFIDGVQLGSARLFNNRNKKNESLSEDIRQVVLMLQAQKAEANGDMEKFQEIKARALHEKSLLEDPEFKALVLEAYTKATETGFKYTDPQYQEVFNDVMAKAKDMHPNIQQKIANISEKKSEREGSDTELQPQPVRPVQQTELSVDQMRTSKGDIYQN